MGRDASGWDSIAGTRLWIQPGERIFWRGEPDSGVIFGPEDVILIPFSILWGGFAIFWEVGVTMQGWSVGTLWGVPFVLIGLYLIFGRFVYKHVNRRHTRYAITDRRVVVARKAGREVQSALLSQPSQVKRRRDGRHATLTWQLPGSQPPRRWPFGSSSTPFGLGSMDSGWPMGTQSSQGGLGFYDIVDPDAALRAIGAVGMQGGEMVTFPRP